MNMRIELISVLMIAFGLSATAQSQVEQQTLEELLLRDRVVQVEITVAEDDWDELRMQTRLLSDSLSPERQYEIIDSPFSHVPAEVTIDGVTYENVGIRKKGFLGSLHQRRPSLKIKLDRYQESPGLDGVVSLTLNNNNQDTTLMSQFIGYELFRKAGVPAPRASLAQVTVNGVNLGVYSHIESMRKPFIERLFGDSEGTLYEGTVVDFYDDWDQSFERKFGPKKAGRDQLKSLIAALELEDDAKAEEAIWKVVDQDAFYRFWAMEGLLSFWDGYSGNRNNFFVYHDAKSDKLHFIPWGADCMFETYSKLGVDPESPRSVRVVGRLAHRLYQIPSARARYARKMKDLLADVWDEEAVLAEIARVEAMARPYLSESQKSSFDPERIRDFVENRRAMIEPEIMGEDMPLWTSTPEPPPIIDVNKSPDESLHAAAKLGDLDAIKMHLAKGMDVNAREDGGGTALGMASVAGQVEAMRYLIDQGADVNAASNDGGVALHGAAFFGEVEAVELLLASGADPNVRNNDGFTPADVSSAPWNEEMQGIAKFWSGWIGLRVDMDKVEENRPKAAMIIAQNGGMFSFMLPEPEASVMTSAARDGILKELKRALEEGADINELDDKGIAPLSWAALTGQDEVIAFLLENKADINRRNGDGGTPLHAAAFLGHDSTVRLLLEKGADPTLRNNNGQTALATMGNGWNPQMRGIVQYIAGLLEIEVDLDAVGKAWPGIMKQLRQAKS